MAKKSAGLLLYRRAADGRLEFLLVHPGGPFWKNKDQGSWTIPKGELQPDENPIDGARREVTEELGFCPDGDWTELEPIKQKGGKIVFAWAAEADWDPARLRSNTFTVVWPPRSGRTQTFPEVDQAQYFALEEALIKINPAQVPFLRQLAGLVGDGRKTPIA